MQLSICPSSTLGVPNKTMIEKQDISTKIKIVRLAIHRGEEILFNYKLKSGKTIVGRTTKPIDSDKHLTLYGLDNWNGMLGQENAYKIPYMEDIERKVVTDGYISDQYDPERSILKNRPRPQRI